MAYQKDIIPKLDKKLAKLAKKNPVQVVIVNKKMHEVLENPYRYKILKNNMKGIRRVHVDSSFVLIFEIEEEVVKFLDYDHHDNIYY